jgi:uncharacterized protein YjbI with pentapeptide repeats
VNISDIRDDGTDYLAGETITGRLEPRDELRGVVFEGCTFTGCVLDEAVLRNCDFIDCRFDSCSLSQTKLPGTSFADCVLKGCRALSVAWTSVIAGTLSVAPLTFEGCKLTYSSFVGSTLRRWSFIDCDLSEADFSDAVLTATSFEHCNLANARFVGADLRGVSLISSYNYYFDPREAKVAGLRVTPDGGAQLLRAFGIEVRE